MTRTDKTSKMLRLLADQLDQDIGYVPDFAFVMVIPDTDEVMHTHRVQENPAEVLMGIGMTKRSIYNEVDPL
jgi:uncharacterized protein YgfB (UPF0149 family)